MASESSHDGDMADVYQAFGHAAFWACLWEMELVALAATIYKIKNPKTTPTQLHQLDAKLRKKPVGQWTKTDLKDFLDANPKALAFFEEVIEERNRLMHRFYEEQVPNLNSQSGRKFALKELEEIRQKLRAGQAFVKHAYMHLARQHFAGIDILMDEARKRAKKNWES
jgi:hypothetical protein